MRRLSLDETLPDGRSVHELIADPRTVDDPPDEPADDEPTGPDAEPDALALPDADAVANLAVFLDRTKRDRSEASRLRRKAQAAAAIARASERAFSAWCDAYMQGLRALGLSETGLVVLSPQQRAIVLARVELAANKEDPTHHAVARRLELAASAVVVQTKRIRAKLRAIPDATQGRPAAPMPGGDVLPPAA